MNVPAAFPISFRVPKNSTVTFINQEAAASNDLFISDDRNALLTNFPDPAVTKIASGGTVFQWPAFSGVLWLRASPGDITKLAVLYS